MANVTKKERAARFSKILNSAKIGQTLTEHFAELLDLLKEHPAAEEKIGCGVAAFKVDLVPPYFGRGFHVIRTDGSIDDFSYRICLNGRPTAAQMATKALRNEIFEQIDGFRRSTFGAQAVRCALTGVSIEWKNADVDHAPPNTFASIVGSFLRA